jgi:hypothetical protein
LEKEWLGGLVKVLLGNGGLFFLVEPFDLGVQLLEVRWPGHGVAGDAPAVVDAIAPSLTATRASLPTNFSGGKQQSGWPIST